MKTDQIIMCVVALLLGMLLANMLTNVCGCKIVEGQHLEHTQGWLDREKTLEDLLGGGARARRRASDLEKELAEKYPDGIDKYKPDAEIIESWKQSCCMTQWNHCNRAPPVLPEHGGDAALWGAFSAARGNYVSNSCPNDMEVTATHAKSTPAETCETSCEGELVDWDPGQGYHGGVRPAREQAAPARYSGQKNSTAQAVGRREMNEQTLRLSQLERDARTLRQAEEARRRNLGREHGLKLAADRTAAQTAAAHERAVTAHEAARIARKKKEDAAGRSGLRPAAPTVDSSDLMESGTNCSGPLCWEDEKCWDSGIETDDWRCPRYLRRNRALHAPAEPPTNFRVERAPDAAPDAPDASVGAPSPSVPVGAPSPSVPVVCNNEHCCDNDDQSWYKEGLKRWDWGAEICRNTTCNLRGPDAGDIQHDSLGARMHTSARHKACEEDGDGKPTGCTYNAGLLPGNLCRQLEPCRFESNENNPIEWWENTNAKTLDDITGQVMEMGWEEGSAICGGAAAFGASRVVNCEWLGANRRETRAEGCYQMDLT
jgi:hypothetical protein